MKCGYCGRKLEVPSRLCPYCGRDPESGVYQTATVLIGTDRGQSVYPSVAEVPARLRTRLVRSTKGANAGTIIIADRRGRREIARALGGEPQARPAPRPAWRWLAAAVLLLVLAVLAVVVFR